MSDYIAIGPCSICGGRASQGIGINGETVWYCREHAAQSQDSDESKAEVAALRAQNAALTARVGVLEAALLDERKVDEHFKACDECNELPCEDCTDLIEHSFKTRNAALALTDADAAGIVAVAKARMRIRRIHRAPCDLEDLDDNQQLVVRLEQEEANAIDAISESAARALLDGAPC